MRSKTWSRRLWKSQTLLLLLLLFVGAGIVNGQSEEENGIVDGSEDTVPQLVTDLNPTGNCSKEIKKFCKVKTETAMDCISKKLRSSETENEVSDDCKQEWRDLKVLFYRDMSLNKNIEDACKEDIEQKCTGAFFAGGDLACLREAKKDLSQKCQDEVFAAEQDAVDDYKMDTLLSSKCNEDATKYCGDVKPGGGRTQACLREHSGDITFECKAQLFRQERENADDLRLNPELYQACLNDQKTFCADVSPGKSRMKDCLESKRLEPGFSASCKAEFDSMLARRSADFRLNPTLMEKCDEDIRLTCDVQLKGKSVDASDEPTIIHCLQDERDSLKSSECKDEVHKLLALAAEDYHFDEWFSESCEASKQKICKDVANDKVLYCLQSQREQLDTSCRAAVFSMEWRLSGDIDYKFAMKQACVVETEKFCHGLQHDRGAIIECLQEKVDDSGMGADCKKEIVADQVEAAKDYRLNYRIYKDCREDVKNLCPVAKNCAGPEPCGGRVLQCLQEKVDKLSSQECKKDVISFEIKESKNEELNVPLQTACHDEIAKRCHNNRDHSKALACLRRNRDQLKADCKNEELRFSIMEATDIRLTPSLMNACGAELNFICKNVAPTNGEAFKCLQLNLESINMGVPCKVEVDLQGARQASDYRLDVRVRNECKDDVNKHCSGVGKDDEGHAAVLKCFVDRFRNLTAGCQTEVGYAVRMALFQYKFDSNLTFPCDEVVKKSCVSEEAKPIEGVYIGTFGQCLISQRRRTLNQGCRSLVRVATKDGLFLNGNATSADIAAALAKYNELVSGDDFARTQIGIFWITTVVAFVAILAVAFFRRYYGPPKTYTLVVKHGDL